MAKLLAVFGATGQQGGALIDYILNKEDLSKLFALRGITRDVSKPAARALEKRGVEMIQVTTTLLLKSRSMFLTSYTGRPK
jgi:uncharacterized protein YbjT (DUF2867 family)